jgi:hypothetical protein
MKKLIAIATIAASFSASAIEVGASVGRSFNSTDKPTFGLSASQKVGEFGLVAAFDRSYVRQNDVNRFSLTGTYDVARFGSTTVNTQLGLAYLDNQNSNNGFAAVAGIGSVTPLNKNVALVVDFRNQRAFKTNVSGNGSSVNAGLRFTF